MNENSMPPTLDTLSLDAPAVISPLWELDLGARPTPTGTQFLVWAPKRKSVEVVLEGEQHAGHALESTGDGYFSGAVAGVKKGARYRYRLDNDKLFPDPCSRYQPEGPHGPSVVIDPNDFSWTDDEWDGIRLHGQIIYELHVGTFTKEGTFEAATKQLKELKRIGVTTIEIMPLHECPGRWNWGYDGVDLFAPFHVYGEPNDFKRFVDTAHKEGLAVILDVVYNHLGPDGNYLESYSDTYFTDKHITDWGKPLNFYDTGSGPVREFFVKNACYWISEFHLDGLRLDATQNIYDKSSPHILSEISKRARAAAGDRSIIIVAENESQDARLITPLERGGYGLDGIWNDDFHHAARVSMTGFREAYYTDYKGTPQEMISLAKRGFLFQGQYYEWQKQRRGTVVGNAPGPAMIHYLQNHDQVANQPSGERADQTSKDSRYRAWASFLFLTPGTPMLFMGQEFAASNPFVFFTDHEKELAPLIKEGRKKFLSQFPAYTTKKETAKIPDPNIEKTFQLCKLDFSERKKHKAAYQFHQDVMRLRKDDPVISKQERKSIDGAVLSPDTMVLRYFDEEEGDRLLLVNLGKETTISPIPEPLLASPADSSWQLKWSSDDRRYGGSGKNRWMPDRWQIPAMSTLFFVSRRKP